MVYIHFKTVIYFNVAVVSDLIITMHIIKLNTWRVNYSIIHCGGGTIWSTLVTVDSSLKTF